MTNRSTMSWATALLVVVLGCGGSEAPTAPSALSQTPCTATAPATDVRIAGPDVVLTGYSIKYDATVTLSNCATIYHATITWNTSDADVATINSSGVLTGLRPGIATVIGTYRGATASATVRVSAKPTSKPFPARANLVISYRPDPVPGALTPCDDSPVGWFGYTPAWRFSLVIIETQGVGFNLKVYTWNLYDEDGRQVYEERHPEEEYFAPNSVLVEEFCTNLAGRPSGFNGDVLDGVDDNGNQLTFSNRLRLPPVATGSSRANSLLH